jgi:hypothetical protein
VFGPALYKKLPYGAKKDFAPIGQISSGPLVLVTGSKVPATDVPQLNQYLQAQGVRAFYSSNGNGTFPHLAAELFKQANQLPSAHIPYSGGPATLTALIAGDIAYSINRDLDEGRQDRGPSAGLTPNAVMPRPHADLEHTRIFGKGVGVTDPADAAVTRQR